MKTGRVDRRRNLCADEFNACYAEPGIPVVLEGLMDDWQASHLWSYDFFRRNYGEKVFDIYPGPRKRFPIKRRLDAYLDYMLRTRDESPYYLSRWQLSSEYSELVAHYSGLPHFPCWSERLPDDIRPSWKWLYLGPAGSGSAMHRDFMGTSAWNALFAGQKSWLFFPPKVDISLVSHFGMDSRMRVASVAVEKMGGMTCIQNPGDIIYTPSGWLHQVCNKSPTLALTENFINATNYKHLFGEKGDEVECRLLAAFNRYIPRYEAVPLCS